MSTAGLIVSLLAGTAAAEARPAAPAETAKARELIRQLGDPKFRVRDTAEKELVHLGLASLDALKEGEKDPDLHVRERCRLLQPMIRALTLQKRIDAFLARRDGPLPNDLPLVESFAKVAGDSPAARRLYADMLVINPQMLDEAARDKAKGTEMFVDYCMEVSQRSQYVPGADYKARQRSITKADVALYFLLVGELKPRQAVKRNGNFVAVGSYGYNFLNSPHLPETLAKNDPEAEPFKKLFLDWLGKEPQAYIAQRGIQIAAEAKMKEALPLVLKQVKDKSAPAYTRAQTALILIKIGSKDHLKDVEPLLDDKTLVGTFGINNKQGQVQMRDVALAVCIKLSGQKMADYDFDVMKGNEDYVYQSYIYCAFSGDDKREAAHKRYRESKEKAEKEKKK